MRRGSIAFVALIACSVEHGEARFAAPPGKEARAPERTPADPVGALYVDDSELPSRVAVIAAGTDAAMRRAAADKLVSFGREVSSEAWRDARRHEVAVALSARRQPFTAAELDAELDRYQTKHLRVVFLAMETLREQAIVAYAFEIAEDDRQPLRWRQLALAVLQKHVDRDEVELWVRRTVVADRLAALEAGG